jgi:hypothetical protein
MDPLLWFWSSQDVKLVIFGKTEQNKSPFRAERALDHISGVHTGNNVSAERAGSD